MQVTVTQRGGDKGSHKEILSAAHFFVRELFESYDKLQIKINLVYTPKGYYGWHEFKNNMHHITICRSIPLKDKLSTLAHEIVHAFQVDQGYFEIKNWCKYCDTGSVVWYGNTYKVDEDLPYNRQPWELEANMMEKRIIEKYYTKNKKS